MFRNAEFKLNKTITDLIPEPQQDVPSLSRTFNKLNDLLAISATLDKSQLIHELASIDEELANEINRQPSLKTVRQIETLLQRRFDQSMPLASIRKIWKNYYDNKDKAEKKSADNEFEKMQEVADELGEQIKTLKSQFDSHPFSGTIFKATNHKLNKEIKELVEKIEGDYIRWCKQENLKTNLVNRTMKKFLEHKRDYNFSTGKPEPLAIDTSKMGQASLPGLERKESTLSLDGPSSPQLQPLDGYPSEDDNDDEQPPASPLCDEGGNEPSSEDDEMQPSPRMPSRMSDRRESSFKWKGLAIGVGVGILATLALTAAWLLGFVVIAVGVFAKILTACIVFGLPICGIIGNSVERIMAETSHRSAPMTREDAFNRGILVATTSSSFRRLEASSVGGHEPSGAASPCLEKDRETLARIAAGAAADFDSAAVPAAGRVRVGRSQSQ